MVSRHCGFRPVEINASDERSGPALTARIKDAVQMRAVMGSRRPNCVILDEVDGAAGEAQTEATTAPAVLQAAWPDAWAGENAAGKGASSARLACMDMHSQGTGFGLWGK